MFFKVENAIFRIHRSLLARFSTVMQDMLSVPGGEGHKDTTDENPVVMHGDSAISWELLLEFQYDMPRITPEELTGEALLMVFLIAHKYCMDKVETEIIEELQSRSGYDECVDIIAASLIVDSKELYQVGLQYLLSTKSFPTLEQAKRMGVEATHAVMETAAKAKINTTPPLSRPYPVIRDPTIETREDRNTTWLDLVLGLLALTAIVYWRLWYPFYRFFYWLILWVFNNWLKH
ncbi:hypothetical protein FRC14_002086 [Serendipita sp. 396]|nr:hypothetical protein FRC14_002086 [Serendipita sp. 396]